jgi:release factor glutamine methyltransferase
MSERRPVAPPSRDAEAWTVGRLLNWTTQWLAGRGSESPRLDAEVLLATVRGCSRILLYTAFDEVVADDVRTRFRELVKRRGDGEPVAYLTGTKEFFSLAFDVSPAVLVPRPETEQLVVRAIDLLRGRDAPRIADVGTGSGAIAVTLAKHLPSAEIVAIDISPAAVAVAKANAVKHGVADRIEFIESDLFANVGQGRPFDLVASNPPYIRDDEFEGLSRDVRLHEPKQALVAGPTGVEVISRLAAEAVGRLAPGGWLLVEIGPPEAAEAVVKSTAELRGEPTLRDLAGIPRVLQACRV